MTYIFPYVGSDQFEKEYRWRMTRPLPRVPKKKKLTRREQLALNILSEYEPKPILPSLRIILQEVSAAHKISIAELISPVRKKEYTSARREFVWRARKETDRSYPQIARVIARDHTTVIHLFNTYIPELDGLTRECKE
jgi:hypothetical protein